MVNKLTLRPMRDDEYEVFYSRLIDEYAAENVKAGNWLPDDAIELSKQAAETLLPQGRDTPRALLLAAESAEGAYIGYVWIGLDRIGGVSPGAWIYDIEIVEAERGKGYGRALLEAAEAETLKNGVTKIGLNVFGSNLTARSLYESAGYEITQIQMSKNL